MSESITERPQSELAPNPVHQAGQPDTIQRSTTFFIGVSGSVQTDEIQTRLQTLAASGLLGSQRLILAYPGPDSTRSAVDEQLEILTYPLPTAEGTNSPWAHASAAQGALLALAGQSQAQVIMVVHPDLAALTPEAFSRLTGPIHAREADLAVAGYTRGPFDGLLNSSILAPLTRALYGRRVRFPLAPDFAVSPRLAMRLAMIAASRTQSGITPILWPTTVAAGMDAIVVEVPLGIDHPSPAADIDLATAISQIVGSTFGEMETHAPLWQRVRSAPHGPPTHGGVARGTVASEAAKIDIAPMIKSFSLGARSLQDVWGLVLPPVTLLDLKRLTLLAPEKFRMPDELWVRILYDFAMGYRLRTINRTHLLGALTPLYLGWVASFINEAIADPAFNAEARTERLARAFEEGKPYLVRRWRWPDRFNP